MPGEPRLTAFATTAALASIVRRSGVAAGGAQPRWDGLVRPPLTRQAFDLQAQRQERSVLCLEQPTGVIAGGFVGQ